MDPATRQTQASQPISVIVSTIACDVEDGIDRWAEPADSVETQRGRDMAGTLQPRVLKGFRDFLPAGERERQRITGVLTRVFTSFGFEPIDTPILEYTEILLGKGGGETDKQVYRFNDQGGRDVAMRFDLTVPFARYMAQHLHELPLPFKRFHIGKVFRGENTQRGRYREFVQCDFDIVGTSDLSADFEIVLLMVRSFEAMGVPNMRVHLSHRGVFNKLLAALGASEHSEEILRTVDKMRKIGTDEVHALLRDLAGDEVASSVLRFVSRAGTNEETLDAMRALSPDAGEELDRLEQVLRCAAEVGIADRVVLDPSITRGLDYYTGIVFETFLTELPEIGSVCSGGRYDNLAGLYTNRSLPGVGASIGLDRLMAALSELKTSTATAGAADALVMSGGDPARVHGVADGLRKLGLSIDVFPASRKAAQQFAAAETKQIPAAVMLQDSDASAWPVTVRDLSTRTNHEAANLAGAAEHIRRIGGSSDTHQ